VSLALRNVFLEGAVVDWIRKILPSMWVRAFAHRKGIKNFELKAVQRSNNRCYVYAGHLHFED